MVASIRDFKTTDYLVALVGIVGALEVSGLLRRYLLPLEPLFILVSMAIVLFSLTVWAAKSLAGILGPSEGRIYLLYVLTNSLTPLITWLRR